MRRLVYVLFAVWALSGCDTPSAPGTTAEQGRNYPQAGTTYLHWDKGHGYQVNFLGQSVGWLWYPGNTAAVRETWSVQTVGGQQFMCFVHPDNSRNPVTGRKGGQKQCQPLALQRSSVVAALPGDVFDLSSGSVPYRLSRDTAPAEFMR